MDPGVNVTAKLSEIALFREHAVGLEDIVNARFDIGGIGPRSRRPDHCFP